MHSMTCRQCGKLFEATTRRVNEALKLNRPLYCSRACSGLARRVSERKPGWYEGRFTPNKDRVECACLACGRAFWLPQCHVGERTTCGLECRAELGRRAKQERTRRCRRCDSEFIPRTTQIAGGTGNFCSISCASKSLGQLWTDQARSRSSAAFKLAIKEGRYTPPSGDKHPCWKGGMEASQKRRIESGLAREATRRYRAENPHKVREFSARRKSRKIGRLPRGTVVRLGEAQRWMCAVCNVDITKDYHLDHIQPLARGGKHEPKNLQLLCPSCNVRKSAKDPIKFMQEKGFLL